MTHNQALLTALAAYFLWVVYDTAIKFGQQSPVSPFLVMAIVGFTSAACLTCFASFRKTLPNLRPTRWLEQSCTAVSAAVMNLAIIIALNHLPLTLFYVFLFSSPLVIALFSAILKHEPLTPIKIACLFSGFLGTLLAIGFGEGSRDPIGYIAVFVGVMGFSSRALFVRAMGKTVTAESTLILCNIFVGVTGIMGLLLQGGAGGIEKGPLLIFGLAGVMSAAGSILYFRAIQNTLSTNVAQLHYTEIIFGAIFGYILWHDIPTWNLVLGSLIIIASGIVLATRTKGNRDAVAYPKDTKPC